MPTATARKRVAKKAVAKKVATKRPARRTEPETDEAPEESGPTKAELREQERAERREAKRAEQDERAETIYNFRQEGKGWDEIAEEMGRNQGACAKDYLWHEARLEDGGDIPEATPELIAEHREAGESYPKIEVRYDITRQKVWKLLEEAGVDHFESDIGKGGRYVKRDPEVVAERQAAAKASRSNGDGSGTGKRGRPRKFKGFTDETPDEDIMNAVEGKKITWSKVRGEGTYSAGVQEGTMDLTEDKAGNRQLTFSDGRKSRTVAVNRIVSIG